MIRSRRPPSHPQPSATLASTSSRSDDGRRNDPRRDVHRRSVEEALPARLPREHDPCGPVEGSAAPALA